MTIIPRTVKRMGRQLRLRDSQRIDLMLSSASYGIKTKLKDAMTKKFERSQRKKAREAMKSRKLKMRTGQDRLND